MRETRGAPPKPSAIADAGYNAATRSLDAPQMKFNVADAHVQRVAVGRSGLGKPLMWLSACGAGSRSTRGGSVTGSSCRRPSRAGCQATWMPHACCWNRQQLRCPPRAMPWAGGSVIASQARLRSRYAVQLTRQPQALPRSTWSVVVFGRWTTAEPGPSMGGCRPGCRQ